MTDAKFSENRLKTPDFVLNQIIRQLSMKNQWPDTFLIVSVSIKMPMFHLASFFIARLELSFYNLFLINDAHK